MGQRGQGIPAHLSPLSPLSHGSDRRVRALDWGVRTSLPTLARGLAFDGGMLLGNLLLAGLLLDNPDDIPVRTGGLLMAAAVVTQGAGAALKRAPLQRRFAAAGTDGGPVGWFLGFLLLYHLVMFSVATLMSLAFLLGYVGPKADQMGLLPGLALVVGGTLTVLVYTAAHAPHRRYASAPPMPLREAVADLLLWVSALIMTHLLWGLIASDTSGIRGAGLSGRGITYLVATSVLFMMMYLPVRYLLLIEDRHSGWMWLHAWATMLPLVGAVFIG